MSAAREKRNVEQGSGEKSSVGNWRSGRIVTEEEQATGIEEVQAFAAMDLCSV